MQATPIVAAPMPMSLQQTHMIAQQAPIMMMPAPIPQLRPPPLMSKLFFHTCFLRLSFDLRPLY